MKQIKKYCCPFRYTDVAAEVGILGSWLSHPALVVSGFVSLQEFTDNIANRIQGFYLVTETIISYCLDRMKNLQTRGCHSADPAGNNLRNSLKSAIPLRFHFNVEYWEFRKYLVKCWITKILMLLHKVIEYIAISRFFLFQSF